LSVNIQYTKFFAKSQDRGGGDIKVFSLSLSVAFVKCKEAKSAVRAMGNESNDGKAELTIARLYAP
jgi:hypothetical protein